MSKPYVLPCPALPSGYHLTTLNRGGRTTYVVIRDADRTWIVQGQDNESIAVRRAVALIEGKPIDHYTERKP